VLAGALLFLQEKNFCKDLITASAG